jgi:hypothetical protein
MTPLRAAENIRPGDMVMVADLRPRSLRQLRRRGTANWWRWAPLHSAAVARPQGGVIAISLPVPANSGPCCHAKPRPAPCAHPGYSTLRRWLGKWVRQTPVSAARRAARWRRRRPRSCGLPLPPWLCFGQVGPVPQHCGEALRCGHGAWGPLAVLGSLLPLRQLLTHALQQTTTSLADKPQGRRVGTDWADVRQHESRPWILTPAITRRSFRHRR